MLKIALAIFKPYSLKNVGYISERQVKIMNKYESVIIINPSVDEEAMKALIAKFTEIINNEGKILLQSRADRDLWGLPGGCQELGESFKDTIIREIKEETNLDVEEKDLELIDIVSGKTRKNSYPNGDVVINNTVLYCIRNYAGELRCDEESKEMKFFDLNNLPKNQNDSDLIEIYKKYKRK